MEIYLDANATTAVLPQARAAALAAMADDFGNPSSVHGTGLKARALIDAVRARARLVLGVPDGQLLFLSGATEGIQTAVLSALVALREGGQSQAQLLLYGATEHKAVPEALKHWNALLGLGLEVLAIPVDREGRHDLDWLRAQAPRAGLVCTMAANNETGVISDLDGIAAALVDGPALWMVDSVQALGKLDLQLAGRRIDYAPFSGHKLYAPKGIGLLYVRAGAPFTPLLAGGGQEGAQRAGTENMPGIAALGAVLDALEQGQVFKNHATLSGYRDHLAAALRQAFPGLVFNAPLARCLPTTLNFSVPGLSAKLLLDLFDAAELRVSGGSACSAAQARPSDVLAAMGLPAWQAASAVRLSFGPAAEPGFIDAACARIRACGEALRASGPRSVAGQGLLAGMAPMGDAAAAPFELEGAALQALLAAHPDLLLVDVREAYEQHLGAALPELGAALRRQAVPLSGLLDALPAWQALPAGTPLLFVCRSGRRSAQAASVLRQRGHDQAWSLAGGLALWPRPTVEAVAYSA
jgi:cysteine sulfinate desulfinase/cysteine desulfurase-like protein/rhodanese-related sulfurtransferase